MDIPKYVPHFSKNLSGTKWKTPKIK
jgi:hypothetical protein